MPLSFSTDEALIMHTGNHVLLLSPALLELLHRAEFIHTKEKQQYVGYTQGITVIIGAQAGAEANLLAATMPCTDIMHARTGPHTYEACVRRV